MHIVALRSGHELNEKFVKKLKQVIFRQENPAGLMNVREIQETLPHRYPFLLVDRILEMNLEEKYVIGLKNVSANEEFFCGHFPGQPVMPGVLQVEALAQTAGVLLLKSDEVPEGDLLAVLMSVTDVKYRKPVVPGDQLLMRADIEKIRGRIGQVWATASVDGEVVTEARIKFSLVDKNEYI
jgi:beta-hydroxyacyl-ACP dehydratase FabZ